MLEESKLTAKTLVCKAYDAKDKTNWLDVYELSRTARGLDPANMEAEMLARMASRYIAIDPQTGEGHEVRPEGRIDRVAAILSGIYLFVSLVFFSWVAIDALLQQNSLLNWMGYPPDGLETDDFRLLALTAVAGALGAIIDRLRSVINWHSERQAYNARFLWRELSMPWIGAVIGLIASVFLRSGFGLLSGDINVDDASEASLLSGVSIGFLGGFTSRQAFKWIDAQGDRIFGVKSPRTETIAEMSVIHTLPAGMNGANRSI